MIENKYINHIIVLIIIIAVVFTAFIFLKPEILGSTDSSEPEYISTIFNTEQVSTINIDIDKDDWDYIIEIADQEEYRSCDININGTTFSNVGIRPKGNSSLRTVLQDETTDRFSFKVDFDAYIDGQTAFGLDKLCLNNIIQDNTYMKEYLAYEMFSAMGVVTPAYSYVNITVNDEPWGLYLAVEAEDKSFVERVYGSLEGHLYLPEGLGSDLLYTGDNASDYSGIKNGTAYKVSDSDFEKVITMIKNLNEGSDLENYIDVDATLRYFAVNTFLVNYDSYQGNLKHNYYLYEQDGVCTILPWDFNLAFGGFSGSSAQEAVNDSIDNPVSGTTLEERPLLGKLLEIPEYKELYYQYLDELLSTYFESGLFDETLDSIDLLINTYIENDATAFCTYQEYEASLPVLKQFAALRAQAISAQLAGDTEEIDASSINLRDLGSMGAGGKAGGRGNAPDNAGGQPADMQPPDIGANPGDWGNTSANTGILPPDMQPPSGETAAFSSEADAAANTENTGNMVSAAADVNTRDPDLGNQANRENTSAAMKIIRNAEDGELSKEQIAELKDLGFDEEQIEKMLTMPAMGDRPTGQALGPGGEAGRMPGGAAEGNKNTKPDEAGSTLTATQLYYLGGWTGLLLAGLLLAGLFKKRKYRS